MSDALMKEVNEAVRKDQWSVLWKRLGNHVIGVSIAIIIATVAYVMWDKHQESQSVKATASMLEGMEAYAQDRIPGARMAFETAADVAPSRLASLIDVWRYYTADNTGTNTPDALSDAAARYKSSDALSDLKALHLLANMSPEQTAPEALIARISADNFTFSDTADEVLAAYYLSKNDTEKARHILAEAELDPSRNPSQRERIAMMMQQLPPLAIEETPAADAS